MSRKELWDQVDANLYDVLAIPVSANDAAIQEAWRAAAKRTHPDLGGTVSDFQAAEIAYQVLSDPDLRLRYDQATLPPAQRRVSPTWTPPSSQPTNSGPFVPRSQWTASNFGTWQPRQTQQEPPVPSPPPRHWNPWLVALAIGVVFAIVIASAVLGIFTFTLLFGLGVVFVAMLISSNSNRRR